MAYSIEETSLVGFVGHAKRRLEVRRQPDGMLLLVIRQRHAHTGELIIVPGSLLSLLHGETNDLIELLLDARRSTPRGSARA